MLDKAKAAIAASTPQSSVYIGCDSIRYKKKVKGRNQWFARYTTVVVIHMDSSKGCKIFYKTEVLPDYGQKTESLFNRMITETNFAVEVAQEIIPVLGDRHLEIHLDINTEVQHKSQMALDAARGYVRGVLGIEPKVKPDGWAATHAADHLVKNKTIGTRF
jgi:predicted RNase H-related nuclease YkuK (DUF458 family)